MPKEIMDVATFNARYFSNRLGKTGGPRYQYLLDKLNKYHLYKGGTTPASFEKMKTTCEKIAWKGAEILTASKQPADSEKRKVVLDVIAQVQNEQKYLGRKLHMGLKPTTSSADAKAKYKAGVGQGYKDANGGAPGSGTRRLDRGDWTGQQAHADNYWLEAYDRKHRPGFLLNAEWIKWLRDKDLSYRMSFWDWLDSREAAGDVVKDQTFDPRDAAKTKFDMNVRYLTPDERKDYVLTPKTGVLHDVNDHVYDTTPETTAFSGKGWAIYVMDQAGTLYAGSHIVGYFHHSTFLAGAPTRAAGELIVTNGKVQVLTGKSGHYKPSEEEVLSAVNVLLGAGVMPANAIVKPSFGGRSWYRASVYQANGGIVSWADELKRADVELMIPAAARQAQKVKDSIPQF